ncbi:WXG100 family type VII secretion target [Amycolatopsis japonica]
MTEPAPYPEGDAATVQDAADFLSTVCGPAVATGVRVILDEIRKLLGDRTIPSSRAGQWGEAQKTPSTVADGLNTKLGSLDAYWQGGAFDAFKTHTDRVVQECDLTAAKLGEVGSLLAQTIAFVHETWGMAIGFITKAAAGCASLLDPTEVLGAINDLATSYADLIENAFSTMGEFAANVKAVEISALSFPAPGTLPSEVSNPDKWVLEPAPEHPPEDKKLPAEAGMGESQGGVTTPDEPDTAEAEPA